MKTLNIIENENFYLDLKNQNPIRFIIKKILAPFLQIQYKALIKICKIKNNSKKYKVSICAIFKNEARYFKEWIEFHKIIGIDHFYLYNNFSDDNYKEILAQYIKNGDVTLIDWPVQQGQISAYKDCIKNYKNETEWLGFIDLDEFVVPKKINSIYEFLLNFKKYPSVLIYWKIFGSSGLIERKEDSLVTESFFSCWDKYDAVGKCFYNTAFGFNLEHKKNSSLHHRCYGTIGNKIIPPVNCFHNFPVFDFNKTNTSEFPIQINHYFTKSFNEYIEKAAKGDVYFAQNPRNLDYFYAHEHRCTSSDFSIYKYLIELKNALQKGN